MSFETEGTLYKKFETESKTETFRTREFVIKHEGQYPQFIKFQLTQDRCDLIDKLDEGDNIRVSFDLRGREWNDKYFTNLNAWRVEKISQETLNLPPESFDINEPPTGTPSSVENLTAEDFEDLPF